MLTRFIAAILLLLPAAAHAQGVGVRFDLDVTTIAKNVPVGAQAPVYSIPGSKVTLCAGTEPLPTATCTPTIPVYADSAMTTVLAQPLTVDQTGRVGGWLGPNATMLPPVWCVTSQPGTFLGCQYLSAYGGAGGGTEFQVNGTDTQSFTPINYVGGDGIGVSNPVDGKILIAQVPKFAIISFACNTAGNYELGQNVPSPTNCTASYSQPATSATLTDGTHTVTLATPFTAGTLAYAYQLNSQGSVNIGLTAIGATTQMASVSLNWLPRTFYGVATGGGATGANAVGNTAVLSGASGTLGSWGLGATTGTFTVSPSSQYIYVLDTLPGRAFKVNGFNTAFSSVSISFVNQYGVTVPMYLYASPTFLTGTYAVEVD